MRYPEALSVISTKLKAEQKSTTNSMEPPPPEEHPA